MMENIHSTRLAYSSFEYETDYEESPYFRALQKSVDRRAVLILAANEEVQLANAKKAARYLAKNKFSVYVDYPLDGSKNKTKGIHAVERGSEAFWDVLATAKYVLAQTSLPVEFISRDEQIVINDIILKGKTLTKVASRNLNNRKSDCFIRNPYRTVGMDFDMVLKDIIKGRLQKAEKKANSKKELLFAVDLYRDRHALELFERIAGRIDLKKYNVSLLVDNLYLEQHKKKLSSLNSKFAVYLKKGKLIRSAADDKKLTYLNKEFGFIKNVNEINGFVPPYVYTWEKKRLFGTAEFDTVINIGLQSFYWIWLLKSCAKEKYILIDQSSYQQTNTETATGNANCAAAADDVYYLSYDCMTSAMKLSDKLDGKAHVLPFVPLKKAKLQKPEILETNNGRRLIAHIEKNGLFDSLSLKSVPYFDEKGADCVYADNSIPAQDMLRFIKHIAEKNPKPIFVIDAYAALANTDIEKLSDIYNVTYIDSSDVYPPLLSRFGTCYLPAENAAIQYEAQINGIKAVLVTDENATVPLPEIQKDCTFGLEF